MTANLKDLRGYGIEAAHAAIGTIWKGVGPQAGAFYAEGVLIQAVQTLRWAYGDRIAYEIVQRSADGIASDIAKDPQ